MCSDYDNRLNDRTALSFLKDASFCSQSEKVASNGDVFFSPLLGLVNVQSLNTKETMERSTVSSNGK